MDKLKKLRRDFVLCILITSVFILGYAAALYYWVLQPTVTLRNWDAGVYSARSMVCENFYYYDDPEGPSHDRWYFEFSDGSKAAITANVRTGFDEELFRGLLGKELEYVFSEPEQVLMGIRYGDSELLDGEYMRHYLVSARSGSIFAILSLSLMVLFFAGGTIWAWVLYAREKNRVNKK